MTDDSEEFEHRFWSALKEVRTGILAVIGDAGEHAAPMTAHPGEERSLFFFAPADGVLVKSVSGELSASFHYAGPGHDLFAVLEGWVSIDDDPDLRARFWSDEVEAWFPGGPDSPSARLLRFQPDEIQVWLSSSPHEAGRRASQARDRRQKIEV
jgi:general stress protein 26